MIINIEKIISLARQCGAEFLCETIIVNGKDVDDFVMTFYQRVRDEALEEAAAKCAETREIEDHWDGGTTTVHKYFYRDDCIAAIRSMKETK